MAEGAWFFGVSASGTTVRVRHDAPEDVPPTKHDQRFWVGELRLNAAYGLSDSFAMDVQVPLRVTRTTVEFRRLDGGPLPGNYESIHHRNQTLRGVGDPRIGGRTGWSLFGTGVSTRLGVSVPLGKTEPNPFTLGDEGKKHEHIQFGTGTFDPFVDLDLQRKLGPVVGTLRGSALLPFEENEHGYQAGPRFNGSAEVTLPEWHSVVPSLRVDIAHEEPEKWDGRILREGNLGRTDALVGASVGFPIRGGFHLNVNAAFPVWTRIGGGHQVEYPGVVGIGVSRSFGESTPTVP